MSRRMIALLSALLLLLAACGGDDAEETATEAAADTATEATEMATEATEMATEAAGASEMATEMDASEMASEGQTIVDVASSSEDFSTLVDLVTTAGLAETLSGEGPFTVLAPDDAAFEQVPAEDLEALRADTEQLTTVLQNHVIEGEVTSDQLSDGMIVTTLAGNDVEVAIDGETVMIGEATVTMPDLEASNGVIHAIDAVLLP